MELRTHSLTQDHSLVITGNTSEEPGASGPALPSPRTYSPPLPGGVLHLGLPQRYMPAPTRQGHWQPHRQACPAGPQTFCPLTSSSNRLGAGGRSLNRWPVLGGSGSPASSGTLPSCLSASCFSQTLSHQAFPRCTPLYGYPGTCRRPRWGLALSARSGEV